MPDDETFLVRLSRLFTDGARGFLQQTFAQRELDISSLHRSVQPVVLVGRNVTTDTQTFDAIMNTSGRLRVDSGLGPGTAVSNSAGSWVSLAIGDYLYATSGSIAGNATATLPTVASANGDSVFEVEEVLHTLTTDATVVTRTPTLNVLAGLPSIVTTLNDWSQVGPAVPASQKGKLFIPKGPAVAKINTNGVFTDGATSPLPLLIGDAGTLSVTVASGVAGDSHSLSCLVRRIA